MTYLASRATTGWSLGRVNCDMLMEAADGIAGHGSGAEEESDDDEQLVTLEGEFHSEAMTRRNNATGRKEDSGGVRKEAE